MMDVLVKDNFPPCKGGGGGEVRDWWVMNGIRQNRPFFTMASRQNFSFSVAEYLYIISLKIVLKLSVGSVQVVFFFFCLFFFYCFFNAFVFAMRFKASSFAFARDPGGLGKGLLLRLTFQRCSSVQRLGGCVNPA